MSRAPLLPRLAAALLAFSAAGVCAAAMAADEPRPESVAVKTNAGAATLEEVAADPGRVWDRFLADAKLGAAYAHYNVLDAVGYTYAAIDADQCRDQAKALRDGVIAVPVSIAMHHAAMLCAEATGDTPAAERETTALAALSRYALASRGDAAWHRPIPVLSPRDIYALIALLGYEFRYEYYKSIHPTRYLPLVVAAWDPDAKAERHLAFDFIDAAYTINHEDDYSGYPFQRHLLANAFVQAQSKGGETIGADMLATQSAFTADGEVEAVKHLREGAAQGGVASLSNWIVTCGSQQSGSRRIADCEEGLIDALLPLAERQHAVPMTLLALAYAEGIGVKRDAKAAEALLEAADKRWHQRGASALFASLTTRIHTGTHNGVAIGRLRKAVEAGNADAEVMLIATQILADDKRALTAQEVALLERPSSNDIGLGYGILAEHYEQRGMVAEMNVAFRKAADHGYAAAQRKRALTAIRAGGDKAPLASWWADMTAAAHGGDAYAMRFLSQHAANNKDWKGAAGWLLAAVEVADLPSIYAIASLYETEESDLPGGLDSAIRVYEVLAGDHDESRALARRRLALLAMEGRGMKRNPKRAIALLQTDAARGDVESQLQLAGFHLQREFDGADIAEGQRWIERAIASGSLDAKRYYGSWLVSRHGGTHAYQARGLTLLREVAEGGNSDARNDLAWALCVSPADDIRDPAAGFRIAREMEADPALSWGGVDTVAACYAATGDFAGAVRLQQRAIDDLPGDAKRKLQVYRGMFDRLDLYRAGKAFLNTPR